MKICSSEKEYISIIAPSVQGACLKYGTMLPSVIIGQACLENGYGIPSYWDNPQIEALMKYDNLLGMKSSLLNDSWSDKTVWTGNSLTKQTPEVYNGKKVTITDNFRIYESIEQCISDYILFLLYASNYGKGGTPKYGRAVTDIKDPETLIKTINQKGYATNPNYWKSVMSIINKHDLAQYDVEPAIEIEPDMPKPFDDGEVETFDEPDDKPVEEVNMSNIKKLGARTIIDVTAQNKSQVPAKRSQSVKYIVCHYLGVKNADNENLYGGGYGGHYYISRTGKIYKAADPKTAVVWQCGGKIQGESKDCMGVAPHQFYQKCTNYNSLGIECGVYYDTDWYFSEESQESYVWLVSKLMDEYGIPIDRVIRHFGVTGKCCPLPWVNKPHNTSWTWNQFKANLAQYRKDGTITVPDGNKIIPDPESPITRSYLKKGDKGDAVKTMQTMLIYCGYSCGSCGADGDFGSGTLNAVLTFQRENGLEVDGYYGVKSNAKLEELYNKKKAEAESDNTVYDGVDYSPVYNYSYYRQKHEDLRKAYGTEKAKYFRHFCKYGMQEGRRGSASFDVVAYKNRYEDLQKAYGDYLPNYYRHYCKYGKKEGRKCT